MSVYPGGGKHIGSGGLAGEQQHFAIRAMLSHLNSQFDPGKQRHHYVGNQKIGRFKPSSLQCIERLGEGSGVKAALKAQNHCQGRRDDILIINNKDTRLFACLGHDVPLSEKWRNPSPSA